VSHSRKHLPDNLGEGKQCLLTFPGVDPSAKMGAMTMHSRFTDRRLLEAARAGDRVRFTLVKLGRELMIVAVEPPRVDNPLAAAGLSVFPALFTGSVLMR